MFVLFACPPPPPPPPPPYTCTVCVAYTFPCLLPFSSDRQKAIWLLTSIVGCCCCLLRRRLSMSGSQMVDSRQAAQLCSAATRPMASRSYKRHSLNSPSSISFLLSAHACLGRLSLRFKRGRISHNQVFSCLSMPSSLRAPVSFA
jgi:hypothetical protein